MGSQADATPSPHHWLAVIGDRNFRYSRVRSPTFRAALQYRSSLYVSALTAPHRCIVYEMQVRGERVTQADRLGDTAVNSTNTTTRHNRFNRAVYDALKAVAEGSVILGDKGDGSPRAKEEAVRKHAHFNKGHCPDIIEPDDPDRLYESRVYSCFRATSAKGLGSTAKGGKPSTNEGHRPTLSAARAMTSGAPHSAAKSAETPRARPSTTAPATATSHRTTGSTRMHSLTGVRCGSSLPR